MKTILKEDRTIPRAMVSVIWGFGIIGFPYVKCIKCIEEPDRLLVFP